MAAASILSLSLLLLDPLVVLVLVLGLVLLVLVLVLVLQVLVLLVLVLVLVLLVLLAGGVGGGRGVAGEMAAAAVPSMLLLLLLLLRLLLVLLAVPVATPMLLLFGMPVLRPNSAVYSSSYSCEAKRAMMGLPPSLTKLNGCFLSSCPSTTKLTLEHSVRHARKFAVMSVGFPGACPLTPAARRKAASML